MSDRVVLRASIAALLIALLATAFDPARAETCARARAVDGDTIRCANGTLFTAALNATRFLGFVLIAGR